METVEKKKSSWVKFGDKATITMPSGLEKEFNFALLDNAVFAYYGKKQWISDQGASAKGTSDAERLEMMVEAYAEAVKNGVALSDTGKVQVIGKERANAKPKTQDSIILPALSTYGPEELAALKMGIKMGLVKVSEDLAKKIGDLK
jgi:hypothetical protein